MFNLFRKTAAAHGRSPGYTKKGKTVQHGEGKSQTRNSNLEPNPNRNQKMQIELGELVTAERKDRLHFQYQFFPQSFSSVTFAIDSRIELSFQLRSQLHLKSGVWGRGQRTKSTAAFPFIRPGLCDNLKLRKF